jgi:electron transport complex protein RnfB
MRQILIEQVDNILPQTQCTRCGYPNCYSYAQAIATDNVPINQCPPGKDTVIKKLAALLDTPIIPLNINHGEIKQQNVAIINEEQCIGCTLCIKACPVDAIIGTNKMMHTVISDHCTGCDLCIPACPVDCITMIAAQDPLWTNSQANIAKIRFNRRNKRIEDEKQLRAQRLSQKQYNLT